jgi:predicted RNA binding protein YcfA (HicA-like mRNA interferase family)
MPANNALKLTRHGLLRIGWAVKRQSGSHKTLVREGWDPYVWAFHDGEELGPRMLARMAKHTGLKPEDHHESPLLDSARPSPTAATQE